MELVAHPIIYYTFNKKYQKQAYCNNRIENLDDGAPILKRHTKIPQKIRFYVEEGSKSLAYRIF